MSGKLPLGWDVSVASNGLAPSVAGGRWFGTGIPYLTADYYLSHNGLAYVSYVEDLLVNVCTWMRGNQSSGTILVSDTTADISWYGQTVGATVTVGTTIRDALTAAGFTIDTYTGVNAAPAAIGNCDIVILGAEGQYGPYSPDFTTQKTQLNDWVISDQGGVIDIGFGYHACSPATQSPFNFTSSYAVFAGPHNPAFPYNFVGAEAIFGNVGTMPQFGDSAGGIDAAAFRTYIYWGGSISVNPSYHTYPDGVHCLWDFDSAFAQAYRPPDPGPYHAPAWAAYTAHADAGNGNKSW
jgi:hypothetical protein